MAGGRIARLETELLWRLAGCIATAVAEWATIVEDLDVARQRQLDPAESASLVLECVFDPILEPQAWRVLAAALPLAA